jgi:hypothetical protein
LNVVVTNVTIQIIAMASVEELNSKFGKNGNVSFSSGPSDVSPVAHISNKTGSVSILLHGGHVLSWKSAAGTDRLFLRFVASTMFLRFLTSSFPPVFLHTANLFQM